MSLQGLGCGCCAHRGFSFFFCLVVLNEFGLLDLSRLGVCYGYENHVWNFFGCANFNLDVVALDVFDDVQDFRFECSFFHFSFFLFGLRVGSDFGEQSRAWERALLYDGSPEEHASNGFAGTYHYILNFSRKLSARAIGNLSENGVTLWSLCNSERSNDAGSRIGEFDGTSNGLFTVMLNIEGDNFGVCRDGDGSGSNRETPQVGATLFSIREKETGNDALFSVRKEIPGLNLYVCHVLILHNGADWVLRVGV